MLKEITAPSNYTGELQEENLILEAIQYNFSELEEQISQMPREDMMFEKHIIDFEQYEMDVYFEDNLKKAKIVISDSVIEVKIGSNIVRIDIDGNVI